MLILRISSFRIRVRIPSPIFFRRTIMANTVAHTEFTDAAATEIHDLWFSGCDLSSPAPSAEAIKRWFRPDPAFDAQCSAWIPLFTRLSQTHTPATIATLATTPTRALSLLLLLDQFPRNALRTPSVAASIFRTFDPLAQAVATHSVATDRRFDKICRTAERIWFLMPFLHSEALGLHETARALLDEWLRDLKGAGDGDGDGDEDAVRMVRMQLQFEIDHWEVVKKFGRYPHRNRVLGRETTDDEKEWLQGPDVPSWAK